VTSGEPDVAQVGQDRQGATLLDLHQIRAGYGRIEVVHGVSISVAPSSVFALLGPNGAGKTTTLKVASGRLDPTAGRVLYDGVEVSAIPGWGVESVPIAGYGYFPLPKRVLRPAPAWRMARWGCCSVPEGRGVFPNLSVTENLRMWTYRGGVSRSEVEERAFTRFPRLRDRRHQLAGTLSGGEQQMLAISRALSTNPKLLLLDEISMGLAPIVVGELYEVVAQLAAEGISIVIVEQFVRTALGVADRAAIMAQGRIQMEGDPGEVGDAVVDIYLRKASTG
jgi:branched-chain amino acid transport system ATP-binding protein